MMFISFHFVQAHCLTWVTPVAVLCSSSNILTSSLTMSLFPFGPTLENTSLLVLTSPARLFEWRLWCLWFVGCIPPPGRPLWPTTSYLILFLDTSSERSHQPSSSSSCEGVLSQFWILLPVTILGAVDFQN